MMTQSFLSFSLSSAGLPSSRSIVACPGGPGAPFALSLCAARLSPCSEARLYHPIAL